jgi:hypothetical protein
MIDHHNSFIVLYISIPPVDMIQLMSHKEVLSFISHQTQYSGLLERMTEEQKARLPQ